jgi:hypothetical protein
MKTISVLFKRLLAENHRRATMQVKSSAVAAKTKRAKKSKGITDQGDIFT